MKSTRLSNRILAILVVMVFLLQAAPLGAYADGVHSPGEGIPSAVPLLSRAEGAAIIFTDGPTTLAIGETKYVAYVFSPGDSASAGLEITWTSSDPSIASVDEYGMITAKAVGTAQISADLKNGTTPAKLAVTVAQSRDIKIEKISLYPMANTLLVGDTTSVTAALLPQNATNKSLTWITSSAGIATVDQNGLVTAKAPGTVTIFAIAKDGSGKSGDVSLTVEKRNVTSIIIKGKTKISVGETATFTALALPENATNRAITWASSDATVLSVDSNGNVAALKEGTSTITATAQDGGGAVGSITTTVQSNWAVPTLITSITLGAAKTTMNIGETSQISAKIAPTNATDAKLTWKSDNALVASVDANGLVTAVAPGKATITAAATDGSGAYQTIDISVSAILVKTITFGTTRSALGINETRTIPVTIAPTNITNGTLTWLSSHPAIVSVDSAGAIKGHRLGKATITAMAVDGSGISASIDITVMTAEQIALLVTSMEISTQLKQINIGESFSITASVLPANAANKTITWTSSDDTIASVDGAGKVTGKKGGEATITAAASDGSGINKTCVVTVFQPVQALSITASAVTIEAGKTLQWAAAITPANATIKDVSWSSNNTAVAAIDATGKITAKKAGTATITATTKDGTGIQATKVLTVTQIVTSLTIGAPSSVVNLGTQMTLTANILPSDATTKAVAWSSSNAQIASVDANGVVKGLKLGKVTITAAATDASGLKATKEITVGQPVTDVSTNLTSITIAVGQSVGTVKTTVLPANATNRALVYSSDKASIAKVNESGSIKGVKKGTTKIRITAADGSGKTATVTVKVVDKKKGVTSMSLSKKSASVLTGKKVTLKAKLKPSNAKDKKVTWVSSDKKIATVSSKGVVKGIAPGKVTITATSSSGYTAKCTVTVKATPVSKLKMKKSKVTLKVDKTYKQSPTISPSNAANKTLTWSSNNKKVATVDKNGLVTTHKAGKAKITAKSHNGKKAYYTVTVK